MEKDSTKFDNLVLTVVALIGIVMIGVSAKAVVKNSNYNQASAITVSKTIVTPVKQVKINGLCGPANSKTFETVPTSQADYCTRGTYAKGTCTAKGDQFICNWKCNGINNGIARNCSLIIEKK